MEELYVLVCVLDRDPSRVNDPRLWKLDMKEGVQYFK